MKLKPIKKLWRNGKLVAWNKATIHILNYSFHYGAAVFEGIRCYDTQSGPKVFRLSDHVKRLLYSASALGMSVPYSERELITATHALIQANKLKEAYLRPLVFYGYGSMGISASDLPVEAFIGAWEWPRALESHPLAVRTSPFTRIHPKSTHINAKISGHYTNSVMAFQEARSAGYDDALMLASDGSVAECAVSNIFMVKKGVVYTPRRGTILPGITRASVIELLRKEFHVKVVEKKIMPKELKKADEVFSTGTAHEITPIIRIDTKKIGSGKPGPLTKNISALYSAAVHGDLPRYRKWLG